MCGIVGVVSSISQVDRAWLPVACNTLKHRGPDDAGEWWSEDGRVGMAHRRLSILDLSPLGHQPMHYPRSGLSIVFNGEIYNFQELRSELSQRGHTFYSHGDTEVLLAAYATWGTDCLPRLNGMFAFALYDAPRGLVFLARDRAGEKPLFYRLDGSTLRFASELKALIADQKLPRHIDPAALDCYLAMGFVPGDRCILQGYHKLPPAHAMNFDVHHGTTRVWRYWQLPELDPLAATSAVDESALLDELEALLENSVKRQLVADVPVGVLLSGGVDSSLITAMAVRNSRQVRTFSIGFPGHGDFDETPHARLIARHFGTEHTELVASPATANIIPLLVRQFDEPIADSSMIPTWLVTHLVRQYCSVALGGDGGDELFAGYPMHQRLMWLKKYASPIPLVLRKGLALIANNFMPMGMKGQNYLANLGYDYGTQIPHFQEVFRSRTRKKLLPQYAEFVGLAESVRAKRIDTNPDLLQRATQFDFANYLAEDILVKVDRASMLNSLEVRAPLLDYQIIEFAFGRVPSYLKATTTDKKILLKRLASRVLPDEFNQKRKQGFSIPLTAWLKAGPFRTLFYDVLRDPQCSFDRQAVEGLLRGQEGGQSNSERLFALVLLELWRCEYGVKF